MHGLALLAKHLRPKMRANVFHDLRQVIPSGLLDLLSRPINKISQNVHFCPAIADRETKGLYLFQTIRLLGFHNCIPFSSNLPISARIFQHTMELIISKLNKSYTLPGIALMTSTRLIMKRGGEKWFTRNTRVRNCESHAYHAGETNKIVTLYALGSYRLWMRDNTEE